ncbi:MAG: hypothetical protein IPL61_03965 [Myxococcales bacterium]|nr:hypothetical protein [Myxococcales bacterium]
MRLDPATLASVAYLTFVGCRPAQVPQPPGLEPTPAQTMTHRPASTGGRGAMVAEMCPDGIGGRPALAPLALRAVSWTTAADELEEALARGQASQFTVLAVDGARAGRFAVVGAADGAILAAIGSYTGAPPCTRGGGLDGALDPTCVATRRGCGLAVATLGAAGGFLDDEDDPVTPTVGAACQAGADLAVDVDGDGALERFPIASFLDAVRAPADEVSGVVATDPPTCTPTFAIVGLAVPGDGAKVDLDVLGVVDVDGDGWRELVIALRYGEHRTVAVYSAVDSAARLTLAGEVDPWSP